MENIKIIEFQKRRDFSEKLNTTFAFVGQNRKGLLRSLLYIAGPPVLVASLLMSSFMGDFMKTIVGSASNTEALRDFFMSTNFWLQVGVMVIFLLVSYVAVIATTNIYLVLYNEKKSPVIDVSEVWERVRDTLGMYFGTTLLFVLLTIVVYALLIIPVVILGNISPVLIGFGMIFFFVAVIYFAVAASLVYAVRTFEKTGFIHAIRRSFYLIQGKWWSTLGILMILSLVVSIVSYVFSIPASILQSVTMLHSTDPTEISDSNGTTANIIFILNSIAYICQLLLYFLLNIGLAMQYFNLVEMKESKGLLGKIETIGQPPIAPSQEEHY